MPLTTRSLSTPITLTSVAVALSLALLVGWTLLVVDTLSTGTTWLIILGVVSIAFITTVLLMSGIALAREIVEGRKQRTFVDSVTHELKSPLASLGLCLETLSRSDLTDSQRTDLRAMMRHDVQRLSAFIDDVLIASQLVHDRRVEARAKPVNIVEVLGKAVERAQQRHQALEAISIDGDPTLQVSADATALETVLRNLLDNALKYSPPGQKTRVRFGVEGETLLVEVTDGGIGIAAEDLPRIFRRFYRGDTEEVRARSGTGLGLYVASELAAAMGGALAARSDGPGLGATFSLRLPYKVAPNGDGR
jgi:signal transduction histidine kinase